VVENVQRVMDEEGLAAKEAARKAMSEITAPVIAITLVLLSVRNKTGSILIPGNDQTSSRLPAFSLFHTGSCPNNRDRRN
jgi:hypothetical protein